MAARHTVIQTIIYTTIQKLKKHKKHRNNMTQITSPQSRQMNSKSVLWLSCLTVSAIAHYTNCPLQQKPDACDEITTVEQQNQSNTTFFKTIICATVTSMVLAVCGKKYCTDLTLSVQHHEKIRLKQLFHASEIFCILLSFRYQTSKPYSSAGKQ